MKAAIVAMLLCALTLLSSQTRAQPASNETYSAAGLYNLANSYARAGKSGMAVLNYERAALLAPHDPDIQANLDHVRESAHLPSPRSTGIDQVVRFASPATVAWIGVLGVVLIGASALARKRTRGFRTLRVAVLVIGVAAVSFAASNAWVQWPKIHEAVVIVKATPLRVSPVPMGDSLQQLPEAETLSISAEHEDFVLVRTRSGRGGWVARADIAEVVPRHTGR